MKHAKYLRENLQAMAYHLLTVIAILFIMAYESELAKSYSKNLNEKFGIYVQPIFYPTVPKDSARLGITITPKHNTQDIDDLVDALATVMGKIIPKSHSAEASHQFSGSFI